MKKTQIISLLILLFSFTACKTAKQMCLEVHNCYHQTDKEKTKYCNYFGSSSRPSVYKKYLKKTGDVENQLIMIENSFYFHGHYQGSEYFFLRMVNLIK